MIDLENAITTFEKYVNTFDRSIPIIEYKRKHSYRVMENANKIARSLNLDKEKEDLATLIGLLHDIGRFEEKTKYNKMNAVKPEDPKECEHGYIGLKVLEENNFVREFIKEDKYDEIIKKAVYYHNKLEIPEGLSNDEELFLKIARDADKLDIMYESYTSFWEGDPKKFENNLISDEVFKEFKEHKLIKHEIKKSNIDKLLGYVSYIFDINFPISYRIIKENGYIEKICNKYDFKNEFTRKKIDEIIKISNEFLQQKI